MPYSKDFDKDLRKRIEVEQKFADFVYKDFRSKRYGMAPCCSIDQIYKYNIKKELCDWHDTKLKTYSSITYDELNFFPIPENETVTTTVYSTTYSTTIIPGEPIWVVDSCQNNCVYPQIYMPTITQLKNENDTDPDGITGTNDGVGGWGPMNAGRNAAVKLTQADLESIPNESGNAQVTFYSKISVQGIVGYYWIDLQVISPIVDWYASNGEESSWLDNWNMPPTEAYNDQSGSTYWTPVAQFNLIPGTNTDGDPSVTAGYKYIDPGLTVPGGPGYISTDVNGELYFKSNSDANIIPTFFGNEKQFKKSLGNQDNFYTLNGGLYYGSNNDTVGGIRVVVVDGLNVYQSDFYSGGQNIFPGFPDSTVYWYADDDAWESVISGTFQGEFTSLYSQEYIFSYPTVQEDLNAPTCKFQWGLGTVTSGQNIGLNGNIIEEGTLDSKCKYIGIDSEDKVITTETETGETVTETVQVYTCTNDNEYIIFKVCDQNGNYIENYEIIVDGGNVGKTDKNGIFKTIIENASVNTEHTLNICYCFTTIGACTQKEIKIIITDDDITDVSISKADCTPISES